MDIGLVNACIVRPDNLPTETRQTALDLLGASEVTFDFPFYEPGVDAQYDVHPDGEQFVIVRTQSAGRLIVTLNVMQRN